MHTLSQQRMRVDAMNTREAIAFIRSHGVVLESAQGAEPSLAAAIAGEPIVGGWWAHPKGHEIYELTQKVRESRAVLVCTLAKGRITFIHSRLLPAFVRLAGRFPATALDKVVEVHSASGRHVRKQVPLSSWVTGKLRRSANELSEVQALRHIALWASRYSI